MFYRGQNIILLLCSFISPFQENSNCFKIEFDKWIKKGVKFGYNNESIKFFKKNQNIIFDEYKKDEIFEDWNFNIESVERFSVVDSFALDFKKTSFQKITVYFNYSKIYFDNENGYYTFFKIEGFNSIFTGYLYKKGNEKIQMKYIEWID